MKSLVVWLILTRSVPAAAQMASAEADGSDDVAADDTAEPVKTSEGESSSGVKVLFPLGKRAPVRAPTRRPSNSPPEAHPGAAR